MRLLTQVTDVKSIWEVVLRLSCVVSDFPLLVPVVEGVIRPRAGLFTFAIPYFSLLFWHLDIRGILS